MHTEMRARDGICSGRSFIQAAAVLFLAGAIAVVGLFTPGAAHAENDLAFPPVAFGASAGQTGLVPDDTPAISIYEPGTVSDLDLLSQDALPAKYDSRDRGYVSEVRDQSPFGTCWAFATIAAMESSLLAKGQVSLSDLSERHLAYFTYHSQPDALGNTTGDYTLPVGSSYGPALSDPYLSAGGNAVVASHVVETGQGVAPEHVAPYDELVASYFENEDSDKFLDSTALDPALAYQSAATIRNAYFIAMTDRNDVKRAVMEYGAAVIEVLMPDEPYFNYVTNAHYTSNFESSNHLVTIVGWDDDYCRENFGAGGSGSESEQLPSRDGAWLVKNSWGSYWGDGGYYWLSYEDNVLKRSTSKAYVFDVVLSDESRNVYQYDGTGADSSNSVKSGGSIANIYQAKANAEGAEQLDAIAFSLSVTNVNYSVQVYTHVDASTDPTDGVPALAEPVTGKTSYAGYYTVELPAPVQLPKGGRYSVVITLSHDSRSTVQYDVDSTYGAYGNGSGSWDWVHFNNEVAYGQSFERDSADARWDDLASAGADTGDEPRSSARLKAFTSNLAVPDVPSPNIEDASVSLEGDIGPYTGAAHEPTVTVVYHGRTLVEDADYYLEYRENVDAGTASVAVRGMNHYAGSRTVEFRIAPAPLAGVSVSGLKAKTYTGKQQRQSPTVKLGGTVLEKGRDYALSYRNNTNAGTATIIVSGKGNYAGSVSKTFTIAKAANPLKVSARVPVVKYSKKKVSVKASEAYAFSKKPKGSVKYSRVAAGSSKALSVNAKTGAITVKKATKRGTYKIRVKIAASGTANYKSAAKTITVKLRVK